MKRIVYIFLLLLFVQSGCVKQSDKQQVNQPKNVILFIGDGMGVNQVNGTEAYRAELEGRIGIKPLLFTEFPYATMATTYSATNGVTDSAASGTALATGNKTKNGTLGMLADLQTSVRPETSGGRRHFPSGGNRRRTGR